MSIPTSSLSTCSLLIHTSPCFKLFNPICHLSVSNHKTAHHGCFSRANPSFSHLRTGRTAQSSNRRSKMYFVVYSSDQAGDLIPLGTLLDSWNGDYVDSTLLHPQMGAPTDNSKIDNAVETAEEVTDVIEVVANKVDKVAEDISDGLPKGGKLRKAADFVADVAERIAKDAHSVGNFIDQVEELEEKVESFIEPVADHQATKAAKIADSNAQQQDKN